MITYEVPALRGPRPAAGREYVIDPATPADQRALLLELLALWADKLQGNQLRYRYYSGRNPLKDFGISTPPKLLNTPVIVGWPKKAVDALAVRSRIDTVSAIDPDVQQVIDGIVERSHIKTRYRQTVSSELIYSCVFAVVGIDQSGRARIDMYSAERASAIYDEVPGRVVAGIVIHDFDDEGAPVAVSLYTDEGRALFERGPGGVYGYTWEASGLGRCAMEAFAYKPTDRHPFGQSRITRAVMSLTDSATRVALGGDIAYQFSVAPQKYIVGGDPDELAQLLEGVGKWSAYTGSIVGMSRDGVTGDAPTFGQLPQGSMQQTVDYFRLLAERFSMETNIPVSELGVIHDQPASGDAIRAASEALLIDAEDLNDGNRETLRTLLRMAVAAELGRPVADLTATEAAITPVFRSPAMPSLPAVADAMTKAASVIPDLAETDVFLEQMGFSQDVITRFEAERARARAIRALGGLDLTAVE